MSKIYNFLAGRDDDLWVALCLEHYWVTQGTREDLSEACHEMISLNLIWHKEAECAGANLTSPLPTPADVIAEFRAMPDAFEFSVTVEEP